MIDTKKKNFKGGNFRGSQGGVKDFEQKLLGVARVARVTSGGRRFSFRVVVVIGDRSGQVGVGVAKGKDVQTAIEKAVRDGKKNLIKAPITKEGTIVHESYGKSASAKVFLRPAKQGKGIIAGGAVRVVCDLAGYRDIIGKMIARTNNKLNNARAAVEALKGVKQTEKETEPDKNQPKVKKNANTPIINKAQ